MENDKIIGFEGYNVADDAKFIITVDYATTENSDHYVICKYVDGFIVDIL